MPLKMYADGTWYTYSRCAEQCATMYAQGKCQCVDAYMPGISTSTCSKTILIALPKNQGPVSI